MPRVNSRWQAGAALLAAIFCSAQAKAPAQTPPPANPAAPQRTTATYEDWTLRCEIQGSPAKKTCEIAQSVNIQGQAQPLTQIALGRATKTDPHVVVMLVPINVWLPANARLVYDEKEPPVVAAYKRCTPAACFGDAELKDDVIRKMRARTEAGRLEFKDATQRDVAIPVSFKGFGQAIDALAKE